MDVHTMPAVGQFFALRKMRKYPQRIVLIETANTMNWVTGENESHHSPEAHPRRQSRENLLRQPATEAATQAFK